MTISSQASHDVSFGFFSICTDVGPAQCCLWATKDAALCKSALFKVILAALIEVFSTLQVILSALIQDFNAVQDFCQC